MSQTWINIAIIAAVYIAMTLYKRRGRVDAAKARALVSGGAKLVDVRTTGEFGSGHIEGAVNVPLGELGRRAAELGAKERPVVLYCASGMRSAQALSVLRKQGFTQVFNLGSIGNW